MTIVEDVSLQGAARGINGSLDHDENHGGVDAIDRAEHGDNALKITAPRPMRASLSSVSSAVALHYDQHASRAASVAIPLDEDDEEKPVCMFVDDCDTGSQLRKAISHLFGRNKTCTLKIPKMVWVYYCRKHYQRVRYRNARTYPVTQMELVETQIERLKRWSDQNQARGKGAYIKSWTLSLRKREEKRLQGNKGTNEEEDDAAAYGNGHIPAWIINELGEGFDTARMFAVAARLREEIENGTLAQVPEIEFLPDIVDDDGEKDSVKPTRHRRQTASISVSKTPKRKAPEFSIMTRQSPAYGSDVYGGYAVEEAHGVVSPSGKRPRTARAATFPHHPHQQQMMAQAVYMSGAPSSYMAPHPYGHGSQLQPNGNPPRAQNIVPKMRPMDYNQHMYARSPAPAGHREHGNAPHHGGHGHTRMLSYQGPRESSQYSQEGYYAYHTPEHGQQQQQQQQQPGPFSSFSRSGPNSPPTLPSITSQMHSSAPRYMPRAAVPRTGLSRPMHQRSASAFVPGSRYMSMGGRPSSSGTSTPAEHSGYEVEARGPTVSASFEGRQDHGVVEWRPRQDDGRREYASDFGSAPPSHQAYSQDVSPGAAVPPSQMARNGGPTAGTNLSVYPEPIAPAECRSA
ncbi:ORP1 like protein [Moelleriella libera RCEF 2490]|uniref:ORP1 like protein n=1 Tax=Moelleriella libera RCEF 2490 TaxID=1081109 RepID=A0A166VM92_9HYPO|nr:ORP1 like protein [Moelleriella libera RCEF 2490]